MLAEGSVVDLTANVNRNALEWTAPAGSGTWKIIAFFENYTNQRSCSAGVGITDIIANGSWIVDHFSADGAERITTFWEENLVDTAEMKDLVAAAGNYCRCYARL